MKLESFMQSFLAKTVLALLICLLCAASPASAQEEGEPVVIDEVIAQVNNEVITLSMLRREMQEAAGALRQQQGMSEQQATEEVTRRQSEIIASLIVEQLLVQKGRELGFADEVEAEVNRRLLELMRQQNFTSMEQLETAMRNSNVDPATFRQTARQGIMQSMVMSREVDARIYFGLTTEEVRRYFEQNRTRFNRPETLTVSEIFLTIAGKQEAEVRARAENLVRQARVAGADFGALAAANSEREQTRAARGRLGTFTLSEISRPDVATAIRNLRAGGVTDPVRLDDGFLILRVDERTAAGEAVFDENRVREAITEERATREREEYRRRLRTDAYVQINRDYRAAVEAVLNRQTAANTTATPQPTTTPQTTATPAGQTPSQNRPPTNSNNRRP